jgi:ABC-type transporter Mla subunit MlaD
VNGPNVGVPVKYKGVEIGSVIDILLSVEEVEVETCLSWLGKLALPR